VTRLLVAAQSGFGKSFLTQLLLEANLPSLNHALILDFKDEYRGLAEADMANHLIGGPAEREWSRSEWSDVLEQGPVVVARHLNTEGWRDLAATAVLAARNLPAPCLVAIDEAHFVAPQRGAYPDAIEGLATTGRGEQTPSIWVTQRLSLLDKTPTSLVDSQLLGGFGGDDIDRVSDIIEGYPAALHNPQADPSTASSSNFRSAAEPSSASTSSGTAAVDGSACGLWSAAG
jgi:DNA helicase HerA-like ATPase